MSGPPMVDCDAVMRQLWDYLDGELTPERMDAIAAHIRRCRHCAPHVAFERALRDVLHTAGAIDPADTTALRERVRAALRDAGVDGAG